MVKRDERVKLRGLRIGEEATWIHRVRLDRRTRGEEGRHNDFREKTKNMGKSQELTYEEKTLIKNKREVCG